MTFEDLVADIRRYPIVTDDTRDLVAGGVFVHGGGRAQKDEFLARALEIGAALIVSEDVLDADVPSIRVANRRAAAAELARAFYGDPGAELLLVGVTGTCGKTTTTYLLESLLAAAGHSVGVIGTENMRHAGRILPSPNTTPSTFVLHRTLREMRDAGCTALAMEVSSHALEQERTLGVAFDGMVFTNLSVEHLDLHETMDNYFAAKARLFTEYVDESRRRGKAPRAAINVDDAHGARLQSQLERSAHFPDAPPLAFGAVSPLRVLDGAALAVTAAGIAGDISAGGNVVATVASPLIGRFNVENILGAVALAHELGVPRAAIEQGLAAMQPVPGRMERVAHRGEVSVVVDFAHKPGALEVVLDTLRPLTPGRLICVFGCGGRRDATKRPVMGRIAAERADIVVVTPDNFRGEAFSGIAADILAGVDAACSARVQIVDERRAAIGLALSLAQPGDTVLIAGRGAETVLSADVGGVERRIAFDDRLVASEIAGQVLGGGNRE
ncbi:MAG TPA: UDP-N-acetylmuramoyl-L-alanyl-D-glutamate--2,6-diaminopimelate ligase [Tahibacter sp.]|uniref:UDP-N-acetylmuramoyl-L-alanyl-D-glutamate--2, 6-diaminopimelate ligase n=1 Tax=Tahibacter sp. TaxID=2056211 RepID=UPI002CFBB416|nr:UDP-N-acetylmuramoyl-L-alanyl-D-glutamate--2,6-diaminopimelate ligase [Tahibacter sp.]HSX60222.1 UDP-N-acetylmuramoyl-L-alanyl-D-glutamate--2,6-diaminopimelate ligase [Tahibacter sp.]